MSIRSYLPIIIVSILVPGLLAYILFSQEKFYEVHSWHYYLPHLNAFINLTTAGLLVLGFIFIRNDHPDKHRATMLMAFLLGCIFLISYVIYHSSVPSTVYGDLNHDGQLDSTEEKKLGSLRTVYLFFLLSHIGLAFLVVPLVLMALYHALKENLDSHLKIVKYAFPIWLYVSLTGVLVYILIRPYYS